MRTCKICGKGPLREGFCISGGEAYYCSGKCLYTDFTKEEYEDAYEENWAYWTEWDEDDE